MVMYVVLSVVTACPHSFCRRRLNGTANRPKTMPPMTIRKPDFLPSRQTDILRATWLGHACYYVEFPEGFRVLFDPVFSERCRFVPSLPFKYCI